MGDFKREERYIVIKRKNLDALEEDAIRRLLADNSIPTVECVVVEHDWPNYDHVWETVKQVAEGRWQAKNFDKRLAESVSRLVASSADFINCQKDKALGAPDIEWAQEIEDEARALLDELERQS